MNKYQSELHVINSRLEQTLVCIEDAQSFLSGTKSYRSRLLDKSAGKLNEARAGVAKAIKEFDKDFNLDRELA